MSSRSKYQPAEKEAPSTRKPLMVYLVAYGAIVIMVLSLLTALVY